MTRAAFIVTEPQGLHARPAAELVRMARQSSLQVTVEVGGRRADATSILAVLALGVRAGDEVYLEVEGGTPETEAVLLAALAKVLVPGHG